MKIAYDHQIFTKQKYGGISRYFAELTKNLIRLEQDVRVFAPLHQNEYLANFANTVTSGRHINRYPSKTSRLIQYTNSVVAHRQISNWRPDIIHKTYYGSIRSQKTQSAIVITVHDMIHELFFDCAKVDKKTIRDKKLAIKNADHIICISEKTKSDLIELMNTSESKISVVHHGVTPTPVSSLKKFEIPQPYILYVGARGGYKNFHRMLKAVAQTPKLKDNFKVIAFGGGPFTKIEREEIRITGMGDSRVIQVSGDDALLEAYYRCASVFVYPSLYEGFGLPPLEAMAAGCPVISSNMSSMPEVISDAAEFFDPQSVDSISHALEAVLYSEERRTDLINKGYIRVQNFSWEKCAEKTLRVYKNLI